MNYLIYLQVQAKSMSCTDLYIILLRDDVKTTGLEVVYKVQQRQLAIVKSQLDDMDTEGIISKVFDPSVWCSGMAQLRKEDPTQI